jgi:transposase
MCLYVRSLRLDQGRKLQGIIRRSRDRIKVRRAQVILASDQGSKVPEIARRFFFSQQHVRTIIKTFNRDGFDALSPKYDQPGRPPKFTEEQCSLIIETALCPPDLLGQPFRRWSLAKLRQFVIEDRIVESIGIETIRRMLTEAKVRLRRTKTWKECNDPRLASKKN